jgi:hypothetical protein
MKKSLCSLIAAAISVRCLMAANVVLLLGASLACAQAPKSAIKEFGLFGTWARDCHTEPGPSNPYTIFSESSGGGVFVRDDFGPVYGDMIYRIVDARRLSHFRISLRQLLTTDEAVALETVMLKANAKVRLWSSRGSDGQQYVEDGLVPTANNRETGWIERCDMKWATAR